MPRVPTEAVPRKIIRSASETYREIGYERAGMSTIARRLGMKAPALYWYFHSKEEVLVTLLEQTIADLLQFVPASCIRPNRASAYGNSFTPMCYGSFGSKGCPPPQSASIR